jgi:uncharacterized protein (TIGR02270 family)
MTGAPARPILWDIYQEHLDEAGWLWGEWEASLDAAVYSIVDVAAGSEERLLAHLDGLVLGGAPVADKLLVPALAADEPGVVTAAAWSLVQAEDGDHQDKVVEAFAAGGPGAAAIGRALMLAPRADISRLIPVWEPGSPALRALILDIFAAREPEWVRQRVQAALLSGKLALVLAGLRAVRRFRDEVFKDHVQLSMQLDDPAGLRAALSAGLCLRLPVTWDVCRMAAEGKGEACWVPLALLASSPDPDHRAFVRARVADAEVAVDALWALGFSGDVEAADLLVASLDKAGAVSGEALSAITGVTVEGRLRKPGQSHGPDDEEVGIDDPAPVIRPEDALPEPEVEAMRSWWAGTRDRFKPGVRYLYGQPRSPETLRAALLSAPTWRRDLFALELAADPAARKVAAKVALPKLELKGWAKDQVQQLRSE